MNIKDALKFCFLALLILSCRNKKAQKEPTANTIKVEYYSEPHRPQFHFTPEEKWMNDPNGLVYNDGIFHLFYQYYPEDIVWGPMHWGHATSEDLIHWNHKPIALFPDEHGYIFSGSAVLDEQNTSGLGTEDNPPLVAIFTYHNSDAEKDGRNDYQTQGIAYSLDNGDTWTKYEGNPVIGNDGIKDFRDPKVFWHDKTKQWKMLLVAGDHLQIWSSSNLKEWKKTSEFGKEQGAHGGVWECPDMFELQIEGTDETKWVLLISINPGAPNGGSGTQYFIGNFDGNTFTSDQKSNRWIDWGTDNYAGVTYNNAPKDERIFIGWMSNWNYANQTPTEKWRSAMTLPRNLALQKIGDNLELISYPIENFEKVVTKGSKKEVVIEPAHKEVVPFKGLQQSDMRFTTSSRDFQLVFKNQNEEKLIMGLDSKVGEFLIDRSRSGKIDFQEDFTNIMTMPADNLPDGEVEFRIVTDRSSVEIFINKGQYSMTAQVFPNTDYDEMVITNTSDALMKLNNFGIAEVKGVW
ncbi:glycoside hydrolase family 32 protein [Maribacter algicola]|uniref:Glycoside hydrolase family 32 protein n=1 Tax=Meishania litoralis TaxID=3434685 RepID=A0ACC7LKD2_9FLAO